MKRGHRYEIFHTNAFLWLASRRTESIHAVVTDPPYGVVEYTASQLEKQRAGTGGIWRLPPCYDGRKRRPMPRFTVLKDKDLKEIAEFHRQLALLLLRVLVPGGHVILASQALVSHIVVGAFISAGFEIRATIARIVKTLRGGDRPKGAHDKFPEVSVVPRGSWEPWLVFRKPCQGRVQDNLQKWHTGGLRRPSDVAPFRDLIDVAPARGKERQLAQHPSLKPQALMRYLVRAVLPLGRGVVLDPFMGGGSTIAAAEHLGVASIGLEVDDLYFEMAKGAIPELAKLDV